MSELKQAAQNHYLQARNNGQRVDPAALADKFGRTEQWARDLIAEIDSAEPTSNGHHTLSQPVSEPEAPTTRATEPQPSPTASSTPRRNGYAVAWIALLTGITVSIAGNVMHVMTNSRTPAAWLVAAVWPIALLLSVEVITRVAWPTGAWYAIARYGGTGIVATVAAIVSYRHMSGLLAHWGEDPISVHLGPLAIDGLVVVGTTALMAIKNNTK